MIKLIWVTDPHLDQVPYDRRDRFIDCLNETEGDAIVITGDISSGHLLKSHLEMLSARIAKPIYFVLGNHDYYGRSFFYSEGIAFGASSVNPNLRYLGRERDTFALTDTTAIVGVNGWYDGLSGTGPKTPFRIGDFYMIDEFYEPTADWNIRSKRPDPECFDLCLKRAKREAEELRVKLNGVLTIYSHVIVATHVPPFAEASWHEGKPGDADLIPFFASPTIGNVIKEVADAHPDAEIIVLAGHTHSPAIYQSANISVYVAGAGYGSPMIARILEVDEDLITFAEYSPYTVN